MSGPENFNNLNFSANLNGNMMDQAMATQLRYMKLESHNHIAMVSGRPRKIQTGFGLNLISGYRDPETIPDTDLIQSDSAFPTSPDG